MINAGVCLWCGIIIEKNYRTLAATPMQVVTRTGSHSPLHYDCLIRAARKAEDGDPARYIDLPDTSRPFAIVRPTSISYPRFGLKSINDRLELICGIEWDGSIMTWIGDPREIEVALIDAEDALLDSIAKKGIFAKKNPPPNASKEKPPEKTDREHPEENSSTRRRKETRDPSRAD